MYLNNLGYSGKTEPPASSTSTAVDPVMGELNDTGLWNDGEMDTDEDEGEDEGNGVEDIGRDAPFGPVVDGAGDRQPRNPGFRLLQSNVIKWSNLRFQTYRADTPDGGVEAADLPAKAEAKDLQAQDDSGDNNEDGLSSAGSAEEEGMPTDLDAAIRRIERLEAELKKEREIRVVLERYIEVDDAPDAQTARRRIKDLQATVKTEREFRELVERHYLMMIENTSLKVEIDLLRRDREADVRI